MKDFFAMFASAFRTTNKIILAVEDVADLTLATTTGMKNEILEENGLTMDDIDKRLAQATTKELPAPSK